MANKTIKTVDFDDGSKKPYKASEYADLRGVVDFGNLIQFTPYEKGYAFLAVINGAAFMDVEEAKDGRKDLQDAFIKILEQEFKGLSGIEDISSENMDITDNISTLSLISKVNQPTNGQITMRFTEKSGGLISKYVSTFLRYLRDPRTQARTYGGIACAQGEATAGKIEPSLDKEVFNLLYVITDNTCLNVEKAYLLLNAQPTVADFSELYDSEKGDISTVELSIPWNVFAVDGKYPNLLAKQYLKAVMWNGIDSKTGKINLNSWGKDWSISSSQGVSNISKLSVKSSEDTENGKILIP